jgi:hypothetical protein
MVCIRQDGLPLCRYFGRQPDGLPGGVRRLQPDIS